MSNWSVCKKLAERPSGNGQPGWWQISAEAVEPRTLTSGDGGLSDLRSRQRKTNVMWFGHPFCQALVQITTEKGFCLFERCG